MGESSVCEWIEALGSRDYDVRADAKKHLLDSEACVIEPLIATVNAAMGRQAWEAASVLAQNDDPRVRCLMCELLKSPNVILTQIAAQALIRYGEQGATCLLKALPVSRELILD